MSAVTHMYGLFEGAEYFNQNISSWNVSLVNNMARMFKGALAFNQDVTNWVIATGAVTSEMFSGATAWLSKFRADDYDRYINGDGPPNLWTRGFMHLPPHPPPPLPPPPSPLPPPRPLQPPHPNSPPSPPAPDVVASVNQNFTYDSTEKVYIIQSDSIESSSKWKHRLRTHLSPRPRWDSESKISPMQYESCE